MSNINKEFESLLFPQNVYFRRGSLPTVIPEILLDKCLLVADLEHQADADFVRDTIYESHPNCRIYVSLLRPDQICNEETIREVIHQCPKADSIFAVGPARILDIGTAVCCRLREAQNMAADSTTLKIPRSIGFYPVPVDGCPVLCMAGGYRFNTEGSSKLIFTKHAVPTSLLIDSSVCRPSLNDVKVMDTLIEKAIADPNKSVVMGVFFIKADTIAKRLISENNPTSPYWLEDAANLVGVVALCQPTCEQIVSVLN